MKLLIVKLSIKAKFYGIGRKVGFCLYFVILRL